MRILFNNKNYKEYLHETFPGAVLTFETNIDKGLKEDLDLNVLVLDVVNRVVSRKVVEWLNLPKHFLIFTDKDNWKDELLQISNKLHNEYVQDKYDKIVEER